MKLTLASDMYPAPLEGEEDEFITRVPIPADRAFKMAMSGELEDGKTLAVLLLARLHILST
jgi:hypothetical protein